MRHPASIAFAVALLTSSAQAQVISSRNAEQFARAQMQALQAHLRANWAERVARGEVQATGTEPSLTSAKVLTPSIDVTKAPGVPEIQLSIDTGTVGVANIQFTLVSPSGTHTLFSNANIASYPPQRPKLKVKALVSSPFANSALGLYAEPGVWSFEQILIVSEDSQFISYSGQQLAALFKGSPTVNVSNPGTPDVAPPVAGHGEILTRTVSFSSPQPYAAVKLSATDNLSGVASAGVNFSLPTGYPNEFSVYGYFNAPSLKGTLVLSDLLPTSLATGTYAITGYDVCDYAGNCVSDNTPAGIAAHFDKTTITVTQ